MPLPPRLATQPGEKQEERYEYSTREMKPYGLLLADLLRAHNIFLMHHDSSLSALFVRCKRAKFVATLHRYWDLFLSTWNVMMHGNPARDIYGGINVAASGELGMGVGEEDRGSGEREVLEGLVGRIEGLVDLVVSKFGDAEPEEADSKNHAADGISQWLGTGRGPEAEDGAIFLGTGALSRKSLRDITHWMEDLYTWGDHAYGIIESPTSLRRARARKDAKSTTDGPGSSGRRDSQAVPAAGEAASQGALARTTSGVGGMFTYLRNATIGGPGGASEADAASGDPRQADRKQSVSARRGSQMLDYIRMAYGGTTIAEEEPEPVPAPAPAPASSPPKEADRKPSTAPTRPGLPTRHSSFEATGHYLIGLKGDIEEGSSDHGSQDSEDGEAEHNSRTVLRTINVELESEAHDRPETTIVKDFVHPASVLTQSQVMGNMVPGYNSHDLNKAKKLRVVVYVNRPFIFVFLFQLRTDSLAWDSLYRSLHHQLAPLRKPLLLSTKYRPHRPKVAGPPSASEIFDLVWDPNSLLLRSTIPNIPDNYGTSAPKHHSWSHTDALSTHLHVLNIHATTRARPGDTERTQKTSLGWWIVWTRLLERVEDGSSHLAKISESAYSENGDLAASRELARSRRGSDETVAMVGREIYLIRRASDHIGFRRESVTSDGGVARLAQGIGVDTRRYVEQLLSLL